MTDIVTRLRTWVHAVDAVPASDLMDEAADEIVRLRTQGNGLADRVNSLLADRQQLWRVVSEMKAAAKTAGFVYRNTDSGPNFVRLTPE